MRTINHSTVAADQTVGRWGNGLVVRLTSQVARAAGLVSGARVVTEVVPEGVLIRCVGERRRTLAEKLRAFDPVRHGGEAMAFEPVGAEVIK